MFMAFIGTDIYILMGLSDINNLKALKILLKLIMKIAQKM